MTERLEAWLENRHAGTFEFPEKGPVTFRYDDDAPETPISLSLPRSGPATAKAPRNFLNNLLPDAENTRERMAATYGAASARTFDLLRSAGEDIAGGLVLTPEGKEPQFSPRALYPADEEDIAARIAAIKRDNDDWAPRDAPARFSLAGTQGKFAIAWLDGDWYWSNASMPSTHIAKPARNELSNLESAEAAALALANRAGVAASAAEVTTFVDQSVFLTERFDRVAEGATHRRLHAEDLAQALGEGPEDKYRVDAGKVIRLLRKIDDSHALVWDFIRQMAFNVIIGNADGHAKNYSLLLRPDTITLSPLYDAVPVGLYPTFEQTLAMTVGGAENPRAATPDHWRKLARQVGIDADKTQAVVAEVASGVGEHLERAWDDLDPGQARSLRESIGRHVEVALGCGKTGASTK